MAYIFVSLHLSSY